MSIPVQLKSGFPAGGRRRNRPPLFWVFLTLLLAAVVLTGCQKPRTPAEELLAAMKKTYDFDSYEVSGNFTLDLVYEDETPEFQVVSRVFNNVIWELRQKSDWKRLRYQGELAFLYKGQNCGSFTLYADLQKIAFQSPLLTSKPIVFYWEDFADLTVKYLDGIQIHLGDYLPLIFDTERSIFKKIQEVSYPVSAAFLAERVTVNPEKVRLTLTEGDKEKTYNCKEYIVNYGDASYEDYKTLLLTILENEEVCRLLREKIEQAVEIAKNNGDLETWPWTEEEIRAFAGNLDLHLSRLAEALAGGFHGLITPGVTYGPGAGGEGVQNIDYRIYIDKSGLIRNMVIGMDQTIYVEEEEPVMSSFTLEMQMFNFGKDLSFLAFDPAGAFNAGKASPEEWKALGEEIGYNLLGQLFLNPLFRDLAAVFETGEEEAVEAF